MADVVLFERNRVLATRLARVLRAGCESFELIESPSPVQARVLACDAAELDVAREIAPDARYLVWTQEPTVPLLSLALQDARVSNVIGWPSFDSMPRPWEVLYAVRRLLGHERPSLRELLAWGSAQHKFRPHTTAELESTVAGIGELAEGAGAPNRTALRLAEAGHELLMNAMYDAPIDQYGEPRFAFRRDEAIELTTDEAPTVRVGSDGNLLALEVSDPFGRLERASLLGGIARGAAKEATLDTRGGGAGLGLARIFATGFALLVDVVPGQRTTLTVLVDLDVRVREARTLPLSLHWFGA